MTIIFSNDSLLTYHYVDYNFTLPFNKKLNKVILMNYLFSNDNQIIWSQRPDVINYTAYKYQVYLVI